MCDGPPRATLIAEPKHTGPPVAPTAGVSCFGGSGHLLIPCKSPHWAEQGLAETDFLEESGHQAPSRS